MGQTGSAARLNAGSSSRTTAPSPVQFGDAATYQPQRNALTARELEIVRLVAEGWKNAEIAKQLGRTEMMVKNWMRGIYDKLGMHNRVELALWYVRHIEVK